jgi:OOP family OmpA-OmpF porin
MADPKYVYLGKCTTLNWSTENATSVMIDQGIGSVSTSGSKEVCPKEKTMYTITAENAGGPARAVVEVPVFHRTEIHVNFDTDKAEIRKADLPELQKAVEFVKHYPDTKILVVGHTDSTGSEAYNQKLSERRANAVKKYLVDSGHVKVDMITSEGRGETEPIADNKTKEGRFKNRRVEISEHGK